MIAKPLSAEVLVPGGRDGEVVCCCEEAEPGVVGVGRRSLIVPCSPLAQIVSRDTWFTPFGGGLSQSLHG